MTTTNVLDLADGRRFAWREYGAPDGVPCVYVTGTPASGRAGALYDTAARAAGVRWISVDKPGYGESDFQRGRTLTKFADDIKELAEHLRLGRFAVAGESGGGPHALALAHELPDHLTVALVLAGIGPANQASVRQGMKPMNQVLVAIGQRAPWALRVPMALMGRVLTNDKLMRRFERMQLRAAPQADRELMTGIDMTELRRAASEAFQYGSRGAAQEMAIICQPWGFALQDICCPVQLWHGTDDVNVPVGVARAVAAEVPGCVAHILDGAGHSVALTQQHDIMAAIMTAAAA